MSSEVFLDDDGIINVRSVGFSNFQKAEEINYLLHELSALQRERGQDVLVLTDVSQVTGADFEGRAEAFKIVKELEYSKLAVFGANPLIKGYANIILFAGGHSEKAKYFNSKKQALNWLKK